LGQRIAREISAAPRVRAFCAAPRRTRRAHVQGPATPPRHAEDTHFLFKQRDSRTYFKKTPASKPLKPPQPCRSPRRPAPAGQPWRPAAAQKYATLNVIQHPQTRWWVHKNIPRANMNNQGSMQDQILGQGITRGISTAPPGASIPGPCGQRWPKQNMAIPELISTAEGARSTRQLTYHRL